MSPFRWDVIAVAFVLALPVLAMGVRGDLSTSEMTTRLPWCLLGGYVAVALLRYASKPRRTGPASRTVDPAESVDSETSAAS
jgi:hypothetical protein